MPKSIKSSEKELAKTDRKRKYFGTDGIRGVANNCPLDPETLVRLGKACATIFLKDKNRKHRILIGKDTRLSGYMIETSLAAGITSMGVDVLLVGPLPTPGVAYLTKSMRVDAGIMISASHNAYEDNGIKIFGADGFKLADALELELEALMEPGVLADKAADASNIGKAQRIDDAVGRYTVFLKGCFSRELTLEGLRVGLDCANGAAYIVAPQTFSELGAEVVSRGVSPNGRNINAGFGSLYPEVVRKLVLEHNLDIGISLDGDADRAILIDDKGTIVDGDMVLAACAVEFKRRGILKSSAVVSTVMANLGLAKFLRGHGIALYQTQVGDRHVLEEMLLKGCELGGEQSGHTIFSHYSTTGDGILTALMVLSIVQRHGLRLSEILKGYVRFPQKLINVKVSYKPVLESIESIRKAIETSSQELSESGRVLVRYSGTEDKARVMVEAESEEACLHHAQLIAAVIEKEIGA